MRKLVLPLVVLCALAVTAAAFAGTRGSGWSAKLTVAQEVPKQAVKAPAANGAFTATLSGRSPCLAACIERNSLALLIKSGASRSGADAIFGPAGARDFSPQASGLPLSTEERVSLPYPGGDVSGRDFTS